MSAQTVIKDFMKALDNTTLSGTFALDEAVYSVSNFRSWSELINTMSNDCTYSGSSASFLRNFCGIILDNDDTGAITGSDAGGLVVKNAEDIVPESGAWTYPDSNSFTINGLTVNVPERDTLSSSAQWIVGALYTWWIREGLNLIESSFGFNFNEEGTTVKTLDVSFYNAADGKMATSFYSNGEKSTQLQLHINMNYYGDIDTNNPNGVGSEEALTTLDRTITHELVHAVMSANVDWYSALSFSFKEGAAELVHGIDDKRYSQIRKVSSDGMALLNALSSSGVDSYAAGYIALRYLAKQASEGRDPSVSVSIDDTAQDLKDATTTFDGVTMKITGSTGEDVWLGGFNLFTGERNSYGNETAIVLDASEMTEAHFLAGNTKNNYIIASNVGSTMWGGSAGNDILQGGAGPDNFWYLGGGNDFALNFQTNGGDVLSFIGGATGFLRNQNVVAALMSDGGTFIAETDDYTANNIITYTVDGFTRAYTKIGFTDETNNFTYEGDNIFYLGGNALDALHVFTMGESISLYDEIYSGIEVIDARYSGGKSALVGDDANNVIFSGGNNSALWGGFGSDVIYGGDGADIFFFGAGEGDDIFFDVEDDDVIKFYNTTLDDVTFTEETELGMAFIIGSNVLTVIGHSNWAISFSDGSAMRYNKESKAWTTA